jgi:hypothetical protein
MAALSSLYFISHRITLHVSGALCAHHQEFQKLYVQPLVQVIECDSEEPKEQLFSPRSESRFYKPHWQNLMFEIVNSQFSVYRA